ELQGVWLDGVQLQGASLLGAELQGASLDGAQLQGAWLKDAQLQGASLKDAQLQGASLKDAQLQGASLRGAQLQGASLDGAQLQGASLHSAQLQGTSLANVFSWRTVPGAALDVQRAFITNLEAAPVVRPKTFSDDDLVPLGTEHLSGLIEAWAKAIPEGDRKDIFLRRLDVLRMDARTPEEDGATVDAWRRLEKDGPSFEEWLPIHLKVLVDTACNAGVDGYVSSGIARRLRDRAATGISSAPAFKAANAPFAKAAKTLLDATSDSCPGAVAIDDGARTALQDIVRKANKQKVDAEATARHPATTEGSR
ncbi:pentapeptide repeat-containing protein, partial [Aurantimonas sp. A3-2-R12]|uniref:pentapeptide repeat-containing protein n=1 Tax=Aurantimonas sp. A3-2-R12 TaxID=3114362 RepID=UPI002E19348D|nr:pentapeptide repeat-containing protein [Aurantimonas sp. A3-2-R12]